LSGAEYCHRDCRNPYGGRMLTPICRMLTRVANAVLAEDITLQEALRPYHGHVIAIVVQGIDVVGYVQIHDGQVVFDNKPPESDQVTRVQAAPSVYLRMLQDYSRGGAMRMQGLRIEGDADLISQLLRLAKSMPIDWERIIEAHWGGAIAHVGGRAWKALSQGLMFAQEATRDNMRDAIHDEWELAPSPGAFTEFSEQVETLRDTVDRLAARIAYLQKRKHACEE
jgi:ubiquinone biosynthesis protein UbiJ